MIPVLLLAAVPTAEAQKVYTCERDGQIVYTTRSGAGCSSTQLPAIGKYSNSRYDAPPPQPAAEAVVKRHKAAEKRAPERQPQKAAAKHTPTAAPKAPVSDSRRSILETELSNEKKALGEAQKSLAQARLAKGGVVNRQEVETLESAVFDRKQNIQALQRELGRM